MAKKTASTVAPTPRLTRTAAFAIALVLSVPVFALLSLAEWLWF